MRTWWIHSVGYKSPIFPVWKSGWGILFIVCVIHLKNNSNSNKHFMCTKLQKTTQWFLSGSHLLQICLCHFLLKRGKQVFLFVFNYLSWEYPFFCQREIILTLVKNGKQNFIQNSCSRGQDCCNGAERLNTTLSTRTSRDL